MLDIYRKIQITFQDNARYIQKKQITFQDNARYIQKKKPNNISR